MEFDSRCPTVGMASESLCYGVGADIPQITMEDLQIVEHVVRKDPKVIEQCGLIGIPKEDMHRVYCDRADSPIHMRMICS